MANYCCAVRTNYFRVKDAEAFKKFYGRRLQRRIRYDKRMGKEV